MLRLLSITALMLMSICVCAQGDGGQTLPNTTMQMEKKLKISFGEVEIIATLYDNPTAKDFASMLPITTALEDHAGNEKIFYPERKLSTEAAPDAYNPFKGDITYYAPWGDVAIFYKDFRNSKGLISVGRIDAEGIEQLKSVGSRKVTFELVH